MSGGPAGGKLYYWACIKVSPEADGVVSPATLQAIEAKINEIKASLPGGNNAKIELVNQSRLPSEATVNLSTVQRLSTT